MISMTEYESRMERLALKFASDYGPLHMANQGDREATVVMRERLKEFAQECGLTIEPIETP